MDFELSDDQRALQDAARDLLDKQASPEQVRRAMASDAPWDDALWRAMVDQGWMGIELPEDQGGVGLGTVEAAVLLEEVGRHVAPAPFLESLLALGALARAAADGVDAAGPWIERLVNGDAVGCVAWSRDAGAVRADDAGKLTGRADPTLYAPAADVAIVCVTGPDGPAVHAVELSDTTRPPAEPAMDQTRRLGWLQLDATPSVRLGGAEAATALVDRGAAAYSAELLGGAARVLEMASQYAKDRVQFGKPIGSFQAVKHRCADMVVDVEGMRSVAYYAAWSIGAGRPDASVAASTAKTWCSDAGRRVMASGLQVHGGIGFTWEHDLHLFLKRSQLDQLSFGDATFHRERLATLLRAKVDAGESVL